MTFGEHDDSIIVAVGSPRGSSARGLVRASGKGLLAVMADITSGPALDLLQQGSRGVASGVITLPGEGSCIELPSLILSLPGPNCFTGEDSVEIEIPGNPQLLARVEAAIIDTAHRHEHSARLAGPGEFSARAFLAGRIGLMEAEGVAAAIAAGNDEELMAANRLQQSPLADLSRQFAANLTEVLGLVEAGIDFTDEESVEALSTNGIRNRLRDMQGELAIHLSHRRGSEASHGLPRVVLGGPPNAGKSTLFNALLGRSRMVVSDTAGTTRDAPAERCTLISRNVLLMDTAGIGDSDDPLEQQAHAGAIRTMQDADLVIFCNPMDQPSFLDLPDQVARLEVGTRADLVEAEPGSLKHPMVSALRGTGLDNLRKAIEDRLDSGSSATVDAELLLLPRHENALNRAAESLQASIDALQGDPPELPPRRPEVVAEHARVSLEAFASLDGGLDPEEVLGVVFSRFCVGK